MSVITSTPDFALIQEDARPPYGIYSASSHQDVDFGLWVVGDDDGVYKDRSLVASGHTLFYGPTQTILKNVAGDTVAVFAAPWRCIGFWCFSGAILVAPLPDPYPPVCSN